MSVAAKFHSVTRPAPPIPVGRFAVRALFAGAAVVAWFTFTAKSVELTIDPAPTRVSVPGTLFKLKIGVKPLAKEIAIAFAVREALAEAIAARKSCPTNKPFTSKDGHELSFGFHSAPGPVKTPLVDADSRLIVHTTMSVDGVKRRAFLVYQIYGRVLAALYVSEEGSKPFDQAALDSFYALAGDFADRLRSASRTLTGDEPQT